MSINSASYAATDVLVGAAVMLWMRITEVRGLNLGRTIERRD
jgi:hypothetical protein